MRLQPAFAIKCAQPFKRFRGSTRWTSSVTVVSTIRHRSQSGHDEGGYSRSIIGILLSISEFG
jgi:hypothetical protein